MLQPLQTYFFRQQSGMLHKYQIMTWHKQKVMLPLVAHQNKSLELYHGESKCYLLPGDKRKYENSPQQTYVK